MLNKQQNIIGQTAEDDKPQFMMLKLYNLDLSQADDISFFVGLS